MPWKPVLWLAAVGVLLAVIAAARQRSHLPRVTDLAVAPTAGPAEGRSLMVHCQGCHRPDGSGIPGFAPPLRGSPVLRGDPVVLARLIVHGTVSRAPWPQPMPGFGQRLTDAEIAALLTWLRQDLEPVAAPAITAAQVAAARPWIAP